MRKKQQYPEKDFTAGAALCYTRYNGKGNKRKD